MRKGTQDRATKETNINLSIELDGNGEAQVATGIGFFDHMLDHIARHGLFDLEVKAQGDLHVDPHHTVEDIGICLGKAFAQAVGDASGIVRYGQAIVPMDEALAEVAVDISGRPYLVFRADIPRVRLGDFDSELVEEFFQAFAVNSRCTLHVRLHYGANVHHMVEGIFKAFARALRTAVARDERQKGVPSTKGMLET